MLSTGERRTAQYQDGQRDNELLRRTEKTFQKCWQYNGAVYGYAEEERTEDEVDLAVVIPQSGCSRYQDDCYGSDLSACDRRRI